MTGKVGRSGIRPLAQRVSGDGTTPAGTFALGTMTAPNGDVFQFFGNGADPGVHGGWHQVQAGDCWDATGGDAAYNTLTSRPAAVCGGDDEYLAHSPEAYSRAALIGANMGPGRSGDQPGEVPRAAAIFLHRLSYDASGVPKPTSGCVSLAGDDLDAVLRALVPGQAWFVIEDAT
jgi:L,D-peptidoglycan transpeptidase YkuD (ErfK/YbiS/YcfS/YnhG family)